MESPCEKYAHKVQEDHHQNQVGAPVVDVPDEPTEKHGILKVKNRLIGFFRKRKIIKLQQQSCPDQERDQNKSHAPESPGQSEPEGPFRNVAGPEVQNERVQITTITLWVLAHSIFQKKYLKYPKDLHHSTCQAYYAKLQVGGQK